LLGIGKGQLGRRKQQKWIKNLKESQNQKNGEGMIAFGKMIGAWAIREKGRKEKKKNMQRD
jgi:hypothetical protein